MSDDYKNKQKLIKNLATKIKEFGYVPGTFDGVRRGKGHVDFDTFYLGILEENEYLEKKFLGFKWNKKQKAKYIGYVDLLLISKDKFSVYAFGKSSMQKLDVLFKNIDPEEYSINLKSEKEKVETSLYARQSFEERF